VYLVDRNLKLFFDFVPILPNLSPAVIEKINNPQQKIL
jgi:hypothetical protein